MQRKSLPLSVRVEVKVDYFVTWSEVTTLKDVTAFGAGFRLKRPVERGRLMLLTMPMPDELRRYDFDEPEYTIWGLTQRCIEINKLKVDPYYAVGVAFIGKDPPAGHLLHPTRLYDLSHIAPEENGLWCVSNDYATTDEGESPDKSRRQTRLSIAEVLTLELIDENDQILASETTVSENISPRGAAVFTQLTAEVGSFIRVTSERHKVELISIVRGKRVGQDGIIRVHLEFVDRLFPLEGIV